MRVGLTGGIASGKTTVAKMFAKLAVPVIDTDIIAREVVEPGSAGLTKLVQTFGPQILDCQGRLDRRQLRDHVFADDEERKKLESVLHPLIAAEMQKQSEQAGGAYQILVIPLLIETGMNRLVDRVLVVDCLPQTQAERLMARDGESAEGARRILDAQIDRTGRLALADDVLTNNGDLAQLTEQVLELHQRYLELAN